jgi:hypothetical protein
MVWRTVVCVCVCGCPTSAIWRHLVRWLLDFPGLPRGGGGGVDSR